MKTGLLFFLALPLLLACGKQAVKSNLNTPAPTPTATNPQVTPTASPTPSNNNWTSQQFESEVAACKNNDYTEYTKDQWDSVCRCVYQYASKQWTYSNYTSNRSSYIQKMDDNGVLVSCMQTAGMY